MILPNKYIKLSQSYIGLSSLLIDLIPNKGITVEKLWRKFDRKYIKTDELQIKPSFQKVLLVLYFMYSIGLITYNEKGELFHENRES